MSIPVIFGYEPISSEIVEALLRIKESERVIERHREAVESSTRNLLGEHPNVQSIKYNTNLAMALMVTEVRTWKGIPLDNEGDLRALFSVKFDTLFNVNKKHTPKKDKMNELFDLIRVSGKDPSDFFNEEGNITMVPEFRNLVDTLNLGTNQDKCAKELMEECATKMRISAK